MSFVYFFLAGLVSGVLSGMGMGGGTLLIPLLTLFLGVSQHAAQGVNMLAFVPGAVLALLIHRRDGRLEAKKGFRLLAFGALGAVGGALVATVLDADWLRRAFGLFLTVLGVLQWKKGARTAAGKQARPD